MKINKKIIENDLMKAHEKYKKYYYNNDTNNIHYWSGVIDTLSRILNISDIIYNPDIYEFKSENVEESLREIILKNR